MWENLPPDQSHWASMTDVIESAITDMKHGNELVWSVMFINGEKRVGRIKPLGDGIYAIEDLRHWYFHKSQVAMLAPEISK